MDSLLKTNREGIVLYLKNLRENVIREFEKLESSKGSEHRFVRTSWPHKNGDGGGEMSVLRGDVFEKAAVNWSGVYGSHLPGASTHADSARSARIVTATAAHEKVPFFATGVSLITHMRNPKAPTVHFNIRYIEKIETGPDTAISTGKNWWLGGGFDLTPMGLSYPEDIEHFHAVAKKALDPFGTDIYSTWKKNAAEYYYIKHRNRERGVGGIFFDQLNTGDRERDFALWRSVGDHFLDAILPIYRRRLDEPYEGEDRRLQLERRAHYAEFNLLYDRGTKFGFESGGNPEAILCSMPPLAAW